MSIKTAEDRRRRMTPEDWERLRRDILIAMILYAPDEAVLSDFKIAPYLSILGIKSLGVPRVHKNR